MSNNVVQEIKWVNDGFKALEPLSDSSLNQLREESLAGFNKVGFPTKKLNDSWHYTNISKVLSSDYSLKGQEASLEQIKESVITKIGNLPTSWPEIVFLDGKMISKEIPNIKGMKINQLSNCGDSLLTSKLNTITNKEDNIHLLNGALFEEGLIIEIEESVQMPLVVVNVSSKAKNSTSHSRSLISVAKNSKAEIVEINIDLDSEGDFSSSVFEVFMDENSQLDHYKINKLSNSCTNIGAWYVDQAASSQYNTFIANVSGGLLRNEVYPKLRESKTDCNIKGFSLLDQNQIVDNFSIIEHIAPDCTSEEVFKGLYADKSLGNFAGIIKVAQEAQQTNAIQSNNSVLLSDNAKSNARPQLIIYADDVRCTHGATVGQLDENSLFYIKSRGINDKLAQILLSKAFINDVITCINNDDLKSLFCNLVDTRLAEMT